MKTTGAERLLLLGAMAVLLLCCTAQTSPMAHDEGWYATLALGLVRSGDWLTPHWWGELVFDKTSGLHWLIAASYALFGPSLGAARLPSFIASLVSVALTYEIGLMITNRRVAWWGTWVLMLGFLWVQYSQLATQDLPLVAVELLGIWALLKAERNPQKAPIWGLLTGLTLGLGFFIKGIMIFIVGFALLPYLWLGKHFKNPGIYGGLVLSVGAVGYWFWQLWHVHGLLPFEQMFSMIRLTSSADFHQVGPWYYLWNIPANAFPWPGFALAGFYLAYKDPTLRTKSLLLGFPLVLFTVLTIFPTRTPYYPLQLHPWLALLAGVALVYLLDHAKTRWARLVSGAFGGLGLLLILAGVAILIGLLQVGAPTYGILALALGLGWGLFGLWGTTPRGLTAFLGGTWATMALAGLVGLLGNYSPDLRLALQQPPLVQVLAREPINLVVREPVSGDDHKTWILLSFYTPRWGQRLQSPQALPAGAYAWVGPGLTLPQNCRTLAQIRGWFLVQAVK